MNIGKRYRYRVVGVAVAAALAVLPALAPAGDLTGANTVLGGYSSANGSGNWVDGWQAFASGQQNRVAGNFSSAFGYLNLVFGPAHLAFGQYHDIDGGGNAIFGYQNTAGPGSLYNFVTGSFNTANGPNAWIGGSHNLALGNRSLLFGQYLDDGGRDGSVMLSDNDPGHERRDSGAIQPATDNAFTGIFDGGYALHTNSGQGTNPTAGLYIVPNNPPGDSSPAFVGINNPAPTAAIDVVGDAVVNGHSVVVGEERLRTVRGHVDMATDLPFGTPSGFTASDCGPQCTRIDFSTPFDAGLPPAVVATAENAVPHYVTVNAVTDTSVEVYGWDAFGLAADTPFMFIATGPRP